MAQANGTAPADRVVVLGGGAVAAALAVAMVRAGADVTVLETAADRPPPATVLRQGTDHRLLARFARAEAASAAAVTLDPRPGLDPVGSLAVATTGAGLAALHRRRAVAAAAGTDTRWLDPRACAGAHPLLDPVRVVRGLLTPTDGTARARAVTAARSRDAVAGGARFLPAGRLIRIDRDDHGVRAVVTDRGRHPADAVVSCSAWGRAGVSALLGVPLPVREVSRPAARTGPVDELDRVRFLDRLVGPTCRTAPVLFVEEDELAVRVEGARLVLARTGDDPDPDWAGAARLLPVLRGRTPAPDPAVTVPTTPDGAPLLGAQPGVPGLWLAEAVPPDQAAGAAEALAGLLGRGTATVGGHPADLAGLRPDRFDPIPGGVEPRSGGAPRVPEPAGLPFGPGQEARRPVLDDDGEPLRYADNADLPEVCEVGAAPDAMTVPAAEALVARRSAVLCDLTGRARAELHGSGGFGVLQHLGTADLDRPVGTRTRTLLLDRAGTVRADLDVARLGADRFLLTAAEPLEIDWVREHLLGDATLRVPGDTVALGVWGPATPALLPELADAPEATETRVADLPVVALAGTPAGGPGWELLTPAGHGPELWTRLWARGHGRGLVAAGGTAAALLAVEAGHRAPAVDGDGRADPYELGLGHLVDPAKGPFLGRDALRRRGRPGRVLTTLVLDDPTASVARGAAVHRAPRPAVAGPGPPDGDVGAAVDGEDVVGRVGAAGVGPGLGVSLARVLLPAGLAVDGTRLQIETPDRRVAARVRAARPARVDPPALDPPALDPPEVAS